MAGRKPLVLDPSSQTQQLQSGDELDIPLVDQVNELKLHVKLLVQHLTAEGIQLPDELTGTYL